MVEIILIERKEEKERKTGRFLKNAYKGANRFINKINLSLIISMAVLGVFFVVSNIGMKCALAFVLGAVIAYAIGKISLILLNALNMRVLESDSGTNGDFGAIMKAAGIIAIIASSLAMLVLVASYQFAGDIKIILPFALGALLSAIFVRISGGIFARSIKETDPEIAKNICKNAADVFGGAASFFGYSSLCLAFAAIAGFFLSPADSRMVFLPLNLALLVFFIIFANAIAARFAKRSNIDYFFKISLWISAAAELLIAFFVIDRIIGIAEFFWALFFGVVLALALEAFKYTFKGVLNQAIRIVLIYFVFALSFKIAGIYAIAFTTLGAFSMLAVSFIKNLYFSLAENSAAAAELLEESGKKRKKSEFGRTLFEISEISAIALFAAIIKFIFTGKMLNLPLSSLIASRTVFGLILGGLAVILAYALIKGAGAKLQKTAEKDMENVEIENNYKRYAKIASAISLNGALMVFSALIILPIAVVLIFGLHAFAALLAGLAASGFSIAILDSDAKYNSEIIEAITLLLLLGIVILPGII